MTAQTRDQIADSIAAELGHSFEGELVAGGYGVATQASTEAIELCARREALFLDHTYTGKGMAGLIAKLRGGELAGETALFWHTGGQVGLFA